MANDMTYDQIAATLNEINKQVTGEETIAPVNTSEFITVAQTILKTGYDPVMQAISQIMHRTIYSARNFDPKVDFLRVSNERYGNHVRKLQIADKPYMEDDRIKLEDGQSMDQQRVCVPNVLQTNFYGENVFQKCYTIFRDQLDVAFSAPDEFSRFVGMVTQNANDMLEQARENLARALVANYIGAKVTADSGNVIHLLTESNAAPGLSLTAQPIYQPANFKPFMQWVYSRIAQLAAMLTERSAKYHINLTVGGVDKTIMRHTPYDRQRLYLYAPARFQSEAQVLADTYHDNYLRWADSETVNFWQNINSPDAISVTPNYINSAGVVVEAEEAVSQAKILGVLMDEEATGFTPVNQWQAPAPFNARGGYTTVWLHETHRYWTDMTENGIILLLD